MENSGKTMIRGKIRVLTPVHIGGAQEKHLQNGLDYISDGSRVYLLDSSKLIQHFGPDRFSNALAFNKLTELVRPLATNLAAYSTKIIENISGEIGSDIKINIKNPLSQKPIIPGSSLKGSIRSIAYKIAGGGINNNENNIFGRIDQDIFRYMIVHDIEFNESSFINTKTYNLNNDRGNFRGGWKHNLRGDTNNRFSERGFTFPMEVIAPGDIADFTIIINQAALKTALNKAKVQQSNNINNLFQNAQDNFFKVIQAYSKQYLEKELRFFDTYRAEGSEAIIEEINRLLILNEASPVIRLGLGSGFHTMTGDTLHHDHLIDSIAMNFGRSRGQRNRRDSAKSRKIAFAYQNEKLNLYPMGFVQLCTDEYYENHLKESHQKRLNYMATYHIEQEKKEQERQAIEEKRIQDEKIRREEALKPSYTESSLLINRARFIDAIVTGKKGNNIIFKPMVNGMEETIGEIRYPAGMEVGTVIQVNCKLINGNLTYSGSPKIKHS